MNQPVRLSDYNTHAEYEDALANEDIRKLKEQYDRLTPEEKKALYQKALEEYDEMFGEKVEPVFRDKSNYQLVRPESWWERFF